MLVRYLWLTAIAASPPAARCLAGGPVAVGLSNGGIMMSIRPVLLLATAAAIACAPPAASGERRNTNVITQEQIAASQATNAYEAISRVRPTFLRSRGRTTINAAVSEYPEVYLDGQRYGDIEILKTLSVEHVMEIRFLSSSDATTRFGTGHTAGVIEVITR